MLGRSALAAATNSTTPGFGTKYANPASIAPGAGRSVAFSNNDNAVILGIGYVSGQSNVMSYQWSNSGFGSVITAPSSPPAGDAYGIAFSKSNDAVAWSMENSNLVVYKWTGSGYGSRVTSTFGGNNGRGGVAFSFADNVIACSGQGSPYIYAAPWSGTTGFGTPFASPAAFPSLPQGDLALRRIAFAPSDNAIAFCGGQTGANMLIVYAWSNTTGFGTKFSNPATAMSTAVSGVAFSKSGNAVIVVSGSPGLEAYSWSTSGFGTKFASPSTQTINSSGMLAFNPDGTILAALRSDGSIACYRWSDSSGFGEVFISSNAGVTDGRYLAWTNSGNAIALAHTTSPYIVVYPWSS